MIRTVTGIEIGIESIYYVMGNADAHAHEGENHLIHQYMSRVAMMTVWTCSLRTEVVLV